jgi:hypothetical protein
VRSPGQPLAVRRFVSSGAEKHGIANGEREAPVVDARRDGHQMDGSSRVRDEDGCAFNAHRCGGGSAAGGRHPATMTMAKLQLRA